MAEEPTEEKPQTQPDAESELRPAPVQERPKSSDADDPLQLGPDYFGPRKDDSSQFSLTQFLAWMLVISTGLSGLAWLRTEIFAGICGILSVVLIGISSIAGRNRPFWTLIAYAFLAMYLIAMVIVMFTWHRIH